MGIPVATSGIWHAGISAVGDNSLDFSWITTEYWQATADHQLTPTVCCLCLNDWHVSRIPRTTSSYSFACTKDLCVQRGIEFLLIFLVIYINMFLYILNIWQCCSITACRFKALGLWQAWHLQHVCKRIMADTPILRLFSISAVHILQ